MHRPSRNHHRHPREGGNPVFAPVPGHLAELASELAEDPRPFQQLSTEEKRARLARIRGSAHGLLSSSAELAKRKAEEAEIEELKLGPVER